MIPHVFCDRGGSSTVNWHRSIAFASFVTLTMAPFARSAVACAAVLHVGKGTLSGVAGLQSSSTWLPGTSSAPGFTSSGLSEQNATSESQQSPSAMVQPS